jgi:TPP-dependent 2-oxoacid decarboxylase
MLNWVVSFSPYEDMSNAKTVRVKAFTEQQACDKVVARLREVTRTTKPVYLTASEDI